MENDTAVCKLTIPNNLGPKAPIFLVNFSNGFINLNSSRKISFKSLRPAEDINTVSSATRRALVANNGRLNYQSDVVSNSNWDPSKMRYYVGVRNKKSGKMNVYDALSFHLRPILKTDTHPSSSTFEAKNTREKIIDLTSSFGSKEMKRTMNAREKYAMDATRPLEKSLDDLLLDESAYNANHSISIPNSSAIIEYIPPQNRDAKSVDEIYRITDIISAEEDQLLRELADKLLEDLPSCLPQWISENAYCGYVLNHLNVALDDVKVKYLLYYNFLVIFSHLSAADLRKKDPAPDIPEPIKSNLLQFFTVTSENETGKIRRNFSNLMKDKLLAYMLVLALFIDNYFVNLSEIQSDIKFGTSKMANIAQALGCRVTRSKVDDSAFYFAALSFPLFVRPKYYKKY